VIVMASLRAELVCKQRPVRMSAETGSNGRLPMLVACYGPVGGQTASGNIPAIEIDILELAIEVEPDCQGGGTKQAA
jgi:hypothetical protein